MNYIDIRKETLIEGIYFAGSSQSVDFLNEVVAINGAYPTGDSAFVHYEDIPNLIKALELALEIKEHQQ